MKITVLGFTDSVLGIWKISRPSATDIDVDGLYNLDLPVSEFVRYDLKIESSIFTRELFATLRDHVMWAQTSRVQDVLQFEMVDSLKGHSYFEDIRKTMVQRADVERQDSYRLELPLFSKTTYSLSISLRHLKNVQLNLTYLAHKAECEQVAYTLIRDAHAITRLIQKYDMSSHKRKPILNEEHIELGGGATDNNYLTVTSVLPLYLRAQLARHRQLLIVDDLFEIVTDKNAKYATISSLALIRIVGTKSFLAEMVSKRSCWIAQYDIWAPLLSQIERHVKPSLPCDNGICPFKEDVMLRVEGKDPNAPCPKFLNEQGIKATPEMKKAIDVQYVLDGRPATWLIDINKLEI